MLQYIFLCFTFRMYTKLPRCARQKYMRICFPISLFCFHPNTGWPPASPYIQNTIYMHSHLLLYRFPNTKGYRHVRACAQLRVSHDSNAHFHSPCYEKFASAQMFWWHTVGHTYTHIPTSQNLSALMSHSKRTKRNQSSIDLLSKWF